MTSDGLKARLDLNREKINDLREQEHELEMVGNRVGWLRAPWAYVLKKDLARQAQLLKLQNNALRNCYLQAKRDEERAPEGARR